MSVLHFHSAHTATFRKLFNTRQTEALISALIAEKNYMDNFSVQERNNILNGSGARGQMGKTGDPVIDQHLTDDAIKSAIQSLVTTDRIGNPLLARSQTGSILDSTLFMWIRNQCYYNPRHMLTDYLITDEYYHPQICAIYMISAWQNQNVKIQLTAITAEYNSVGNTSTLTFTS